MTTYRRRPEVVEAIQWTGDNLDEVRKWLGEGWEAYQTSDFLHVLEVMTGWAPWIDPTDYLVRDERGAVSRVTAEAMAKEYEEVGA